jgi:hypothetical protein
MKNSSITRNYLFGAFGGLSAVLLGASFSPAFAAGSGPFTDIYGNSCDYPDIRSVSVNGTVQSLCPGSLSPGQSSLPPGKIPPIVDVTRLPSGAAGAPPQYDFGNLLGLDGPGSGLHGNPYGQLGMYVNGGTNSDVTLGGGGYSLRNGGASVSDTAGLIAPGTNSPSYHENGGGGGISGTYDASRFVGPNQKLLFNGAFDYTSSNTGYGGIGTGASINGDNYNFKGIAAYSNYNTYVALQGDYNFGNNSESAPGGSTGSYGSDGYDIFATVGHVFWLLNTMSQPIPSRMALKAAPKTSDGYAIGLDLSGHLGYRSGVAKGFTDSSGFVFGDERVHYGDTGLQAKLLANVQNYGVTWQPYVSGTVDWRFNYSHVANFPVQVALATGDAVTFDDATTYFGGQVGLDVKMTNGWTVGANGFYQHSSDTEIIGGKAYVKIPFGETAVTARY